MIRALIIQGVCLIVLFGGTTSAPAETSTALVPLETFFSLPTIRDPQLSPDGTKLAFLFPKEGKLALGLFERKTSEGRIILEGVKENVEFFFWKGNDRIVFGGDVGGNESMFLGVTDLSGKKIQRVMESLDRGNIRGSFGGVFNEMKQSEDEMILGGFFIDKPTRHWDGVAYFGSQYKIVRYNARKKTQQLVYANEGQYDGFFTDSTGRLRLVTRKQAENRVWFLYEPGEKIPFREIARFPIHGYAEAWDPYVFSADNRMLYLVSREEHDRGALYAYDTSTRERGPALFVPPEGEITGLVLSYDHTRLLGVEYVSDRRHRHWFDPARAALQQQLDNTFPGSICTVVSSSSDEKTYLIYVGSDRDPGAYYMLDLKQPALTLFKRIRPDVDPARMRPREAVTYQARDGLELHGYLTRPAGAEKTPAPLILLVHGGPYGIRDYWGFDNEAQFLANRGYAVLQVNYRGSGGYGRDFINKGRHQWGRAMQDDLTDAVQWAVTQGIADPRRVAIYGGSYGGYAALAGVTLTPDLYRCAINYVGVAKLEVAFKGYGGDAFLGQGEFDYQKTWVAPDTAHAEATSPVNLVERIRVPTLHAYGENDPRVDFKQWRELRAQLDKYHKPYTAIVEEDQGHGFRNENASLKFYRAVESFLAENLAP